MKKIILGISVIIIIIICLLGFGIFNNQNTVNVGNATFHLPDGFQEKGVIKSGDINISNGYESFYIHDYKDKNLEEHVKDYIIDRKNKSFKVELTNFTVNDTLVYKTVIVNQTHSIHYWFMKDGDVFSIYTWDGIPKMNKIVSDLISSMN